MSTIQNTLFPALKYLDKVQGNIGAPSEFHCGYEAGGLGYTLYCQLKANGVGCTILAPLTMPTYKKNEIKTEKREVMKITRCLAFNTYCAVYIPTKEESNVKEYIRMRDVHKLPVKKGKQQILASCLRYDFRFMGGKSYWPLKYLSGLSSLELDTLMREILDEHLQICRILFLWGDEFMDEQDKDQMVNILKMKKAIRDFCEAYRQVLPNYRQLAQRECFQELMTQLNQNRQ